jgi:hypothetical protein
MSQENGVALAVLLFVIAAVFFLFALLHFGGMIR